MEKTLDTLQANEALLKKRIDDLNNERDQTTKESESWRGRLKVCYCKTVKLSGVSCFLFIHTSPHKQCEVFDRKLCLCYTA